MREQSEMKRYVVPRAVLAQDLVPLIAHDLRTPVTAIKGYSQLVLRQPTLPPNVGGYLASVVDEANQIASLIDDLVVVSQLDRGNIACQPEMVDLGRLVGRVANPLVLSAHARTLTLETNADTVLAFCDPDITRRAVARLIQCAVKYYGSNDAGQIGVRSAGDECFVWVASRSALTRGSTMAGRANLKDTFAVPDDDLGRRDLRMYICARLAELQNGYVLGSTGAGEDSHFYLVLPSGSAMATEPTGG